MNFKKLKDLIGEAEKFYFFSQLFGAIKTILTLTDLLINQPCNKNNNNNNNKIK